jgi:hypothetical protein
MNSNRFFVFAAIGAALFLIQGCAAQGGGGGGAHAHIRHVTVGWKDTPNGMGLGPTMEEEARIAEQHAGFAAQRPTNLKWMQTHIRHVRHAIDPSSEKGGPGMGYGVIRAARGVAAHIRFAAEASDASANVKLHSTHVATSANNVVSWSNRIIILSDGVLAAKDTLKEVERAADWVKRIHETTQQMLNGFDLDGDGKISWQHGEGGIAQAKQQIGFMKKGEGM